MFASNYMPLNICYYKFVTVYELGQKRRLPSNLQKVYYKMTVCVCIHSSRCLLMLAVIIAPILAPSRLIFLDTTLDEFSTLLLINFEICSDSESELVF